MKKGLGVVMLSVSLISFNQIQSMDLVVGYVWPYITNFFSKLLNEKKSPSAELLELVKKNPKNSEKFKQLINQVASGSDKIQALKDLIIAQKALKPQLQQNREQEVLARDPKTKFRNVLLVPGFFCPVIPLNMIRKMYFNLIPIDTSNINTVLLFSGISLSCLVAARRLTYSNKIHDAAQQSVNETLLCLTDIKNKQEELFVSVPVLKNQFLNEYNKLQLSKQMLPQNQN